MSIWLCSFLFGISSRRGRSFAQQLSHVSRGCTHVKMKHAVPHATCRSNFLSSFKHYILQRHGWVSDEFDYHSLIDQFLINFLKYCHLCSWMLADPARKWLSDVSCLYTSHELTGEGNEKPLRTFIHGTIIMEIILSSNQVLQIKEQERTHTRCTRKTEFDYIEQECNCFFSDNILLNWSLKLITIMKVVYKCSSENVMMSENYLRLLKIELKVSPDSR